MVGIKTFASISGTEGMIWISDDIVSLKFQ
jgi:hypothetical protein